MTRKPKFWTFGILALSLNLIPLVAYGESYIDMDEGDTGLVKEAAQSNGSSHADPVRTAKPKRAKVTAKKKRIPQSYKKYKIDPALPALTQNGKLSDEPLCQDPSLYKKVDDTFEHMRDRRKVNRVHKCEQAVWQKDKKHKSRRPPPSTAKAPTAPEGKIAEAPAPEAPILVDDGRDLSYADLKTLIKDFEVVREGDNINGKVKLRGTIFLDCAAQLSINIKSKTDSNDESCRKNAGGFMIHATSRFESCMKSHADAKHSCTRAAGSGATECVFLSTPVNSRGADRETVLSLNKFPMGEIQLLMTNPDGNEDHQHKCESFPTPIEHITEAYVAERLAEEKQKAFDRQIEVSQRQAKSCVRTSEELALARSACEWLAHVGQYSTVEECTKNLDKKEIDILKNLASKGPDDNLEQVTDSIIAWANSHPNECSKAVDVLQSIAQRQAKRKSTRSATNDEATSPFDGFNAAVETFERAADEVPCLTEDSRFIAMQNNLKANRTLKVCQVGGICSIECQTQYHEVLENAYQSFADTCSSGNWQMDNSCMSAARNFQSALSIPQSAQANMMRQAQATQQLMAMANQPQQGGSQFGSPYGNPLGGGTSTFQVPGNMGPGVGNVTAGFQMPGTQTFGSTRPGGSGYGFGQLSGF